MNWHLTSPAPYDPPLTYGGWNQSKALGARIASILHAREDILDSVRRKSGNHTNGIGRRKRKQKVVIHSSPFLRCLQTSVAIGAGIAQSRKAPDSETEQKTTSVAKKQQDNDSIKTTIRVDAFLGEWLSPDYFEHITPPPNSTLMVAAAKASLLRQEQIQVFEPSATGNGYFPGGWSMSKSSTKKDVDLEDDDDFGAALEPTRSQIHRANSVSDADAGYGAFKAGHRAFITSSLGTSKSLYNPPIPAYAVKPSDPIPHGYCVHARDHTTNVDFHWDSMRKPQDWGDGGVLGEEWSSMHRRFRFGLYKMVSWYKQHSPEFYPEREDPLALAEEDSDEDDEEDYELILVLVTHSAGCNALIGALTNHPVLMDFGLTSLSMAVRKDFGEKDYAPSAGRRRRRSSIDHGMSEEYDVKLVASTGHIRAGVEATRMAGLQSPHLVPQIPKYHGHETTPIQAPKKDGPSETRRSAMRSALGSLRRSSHHRSTAHQNDSPSPNRSATSRSVSSSGLWSKPTTTASSMDDAMQDLSLGPAARPESSDSDSPMPIGGHLFSGRKDDELAPLPGPSKAGLWGAPLPGPEASYAAMPKRRWTMSEPDED